MKRIMPMFIVALVACNAEPEAEPVPTIPRTPVTPTQIGNVPVGHTPVEGLSVQSKGARRLSIPQIERSLEQIGELPEGSVVFPPDLALTLGQPDYLRTTAVSLEPSPLFMKFMMDLGGIICTNLGTAEPERPQAERVFTRYADVDANLEYMVLRFTGITGDDATPYVTRLRRVHDRASAGARGEIGGYEAVCIALITSPEFLLY